MKKRSYRAQKVNEVWLVSGLGQDLKTSLHNYAVRFRRAHDAGTELRVPRVAELLADPAFRPLDDWLRQRKVDVGEVQAPWMGSWIRLGSWRSNRRDSSFAFSCGQRRIVQRSGWGFDIRFESKERDARPFRGS